ncbi:hypothetical protein Fmac_021484 [Flemingia macrophylla]|uniref:ALOG domain-containing protein n=1 Tax=Flemingia macrophylla TaxID=520843 RepID=A0ABD1LX16_9FABA
MSSSGSHGAEGSSNTNIPMINYQYQHEQHQTSPATLSRYESQKRRDWNTFGQYLKNQRPPVPLSQCNCNHVLDFLRYLDQFGKTKELVFQVSITLCLCSVVAGSKLGFSRLSCEQRDDKCSMLACSCFSVGGLGPNLFFSSLFQILHVLQQINEAPKFILNNISRHSTRVFSKLEPDESSQRDPEKTQENSDHARSSIQDDVRSLGNVVFMELGGDGETMVDYDARLMDKGEALQHGHMQNQMRVPKEIPKKSKKNSDNARSSIQVRGSEKPHSGIGIVCQVEELSPNPIGSVEEKVLNPIGLNWGFNERLTVGDDLLKEEHQDEGEGTL